jgi:hypothetical protein
MNTGRKSLLLLCMFPPVTRDAKNLAVGKLVVRPISIFMIKVDVISYQSSFAFIASSILFLDDERRKFKL